MARRSGAGPYAPRRLYDVRNYIGDSLSANTDIGAAVNLAIADAAADLYAYGKAGQVLIPTCNRKITTPIVPVSGVDIISADAVLRPQGCAAFSRVYSLGTPLTDVKFAGFEIDGSEQSSGFKGIFMQFLARVKFEHLYIHDCTRSGLGPDYLVDVLFDDVIANSNGRGTDGTVGGCAGIGIGTGQYTVENWTVRNSVTKNNKRCGLFSESQNGSLSQGAKILGHHSTGNGDHGIADAGCQGLEVIGGHSNNNSLSGFAVYSGTIGSGKSGAAGSVVGLECRSNSIHGVHLDATVHSITSYTLRGLNLVTNGQNGAVFEGGAATSLAEASLSDSDVVGNNNFGVKILTAGALLSDITLHGDRIRNNGQVGSGSARSGIRVANSVTRLRIIGGRSTDDQGSPTQTYGLDIAAGVVLTDGVIDGIDLRNNLTGPTSLLGTFSGTVIGTNPGYTVGAGLVCIAEIDLTGSQASIDFTNIPSTFARLVLIGLSQTDAAAATDIVNIALNADTTDANYDRQLQTASNTTVSASAAMGASGSRNLGLTCGATAPANQFGSLFATIHDYAGAHWKVTRAESAAWSSRAAGGLLLRTYSPCWASAAVINEVTLTPNTGTNFVAGTKISLYGVPKAA